MADDQLRLRATLDDGFTGPLAKLRGGILSVKNDTATAVGAMKKDWEGFHGALGKAQGTLAQFGPLLGGFGVASGGAALGIGTIATALRNFSGNVQSMQLMSRETGLAVDQIRAFSALGQRFGLSAETMQGSLQNLAKNASEVRRRYGEVYSSLLGMNMGEFAEKLVSAPNMKAFLDTSMEQLAKMGDPVKARKVAEMLFGAGELGAVANMLQGRYKKVMDEILATQGETTKAVEESAQRFEGTLAKLNSRWEKFKLETLGPMLDAGSNAIDQADKGSALGVLRSLDGANGPLAKRVAPLSDQEAKLAPSANIRHRIEQTEEQIANLKDLLGEAKGNGDKSKAEVLERALRQNSQRLESLQEELRKAREGGATVQQQSYNGIGGNGPLAGLVQRASFGGGGGGGGIGRGGFGGFNDLGPPLDPKGPNGFRPAPGMGARTPGVGVGALPNAPVVVPPLAPGDGTSHPANGYPGIPARDLKSINPEIAAYIRQSALAHGIDPNIALRIANSEGLRGSVPGVRMTGGDPDANRRPTSFGPFQLHYAGRGRGVSDPGLGDVYTRETGHHASDPAHWKEQIDFAMRHARKGGWRPWHGRFGARIGEWDGIGTVRPKAPPADENGNFPNGAPRALKPRSMAGDASVPGQVVGDRPAGERPGDVALRRMYGAEARPPMGGKGTLHIQFENAPPGMRPRASMDDLFREVDITKQTQFPRGTR